MLTAPALFARIVSEGPHRCFYCGAACGADHSAAQHVKDSFTERSAVSCPGSDWVCGGCVQALRSDLPDVPLIDGTRQKPKEGAKRLMQVRWFSWVITEAGALAATPAHRERLRDLCLAPPEPPFAICIADGNKHQLFRTPVNLSAGRMALNCEGTRVEYHPDDLRERMGLVMRLVAVFGKGANSLSRLTDPLCEFGLTVPLAERYGASAADAMLKEWRLVRCQPLTRLAVFLCPGKDEANEEIGNGAE